MIKIIKASFIVVALTAIAGYGTYSYFSDTETSTGNTFAAGNLDLKVDNQCHYDNMICVNNPNHGLIWQNEPGQQSTYPELLNKPCSCNWAPTDLANQLFFNFADVKPGDIGEDTVSFHVNDNPAWVCGKISNVTGKENDCANNAEQSADSDCATDQNGELKDALRISFFRDYNCDNIRNGNDYTLPNTTRNVPLQNGVFPIIDSSTLDNQPLQPGTDNQACIAMNWNVPNTAGNEIQGDSVTADITFFAEQSRNNAGFLCSSLNAH